ncbi:MAG TPA: DsbA family protein, partial [Chitinophagaceae bacterium]|nr:DsbA family protein [Chitinophagaceae bacterium]
HTRRQSISLDSSIVDQNNQFSNNTYQACLAFHASAMQGKKMAHKFLEVLQEQVVEEGLPYTDELMYSIVKNIGLDVEMFKEDYESELTKKIYKKNLNIAAEMKVKSTPSCVVFKDDDEAEAVRLNKEIEKEILHSLCGIENSLKPKADDDEESSDSKSEPNVLKFKMT